MDYTPRASASVSLAERARSSRPGCPLLGQLGWVRLGTYTVPLSLVVSCTTAADVRLRPQRVGASAPQANLGAVVQSHAKADQWANEFVAAAPRGQADLEVTQVRATQSLTDSIV